MPSTYSVSNLRVLLSSTVMTPSLPTLSMTSAISLPISSSAAEMAATWAILVWSDTGVDMPLRLSTTAWTPASMPRLSWSGLAPAGTFLKPSLTIAWASTVAVVVPSPAMSLGLDAAGADGQDLALLGLFGGGVWQDDAAAGDLLARERLDHHAVAKRAQIGTR